MAAVSKNDFLSKGVDQLLFLTSMDYSKARSPQSILRAASVSMMVDRRLLPLHVSPLPGANKSDREQVSSKLLANLYFGPLRFRS